MYITFFPILFAVYTFFYLVSWKKIYFLYTYDFIVKWLIFCVKLFLFVTISGEKIIQISKIQDTRYKFFTRYITKYSDTGFSRFKKY